MKFIRLLTSLLTFNPPLDLLAALESKRSDHPPDDASPIDVSMETISPTLRETKSSIDKLWVDNGFRAWISVLTLALCLALDAAGVFSGGRSFVILFGIYAAVSVVGTIYYVKKGHHRLADALLCSGDVVTISAAVYLTGGPISPLYILYFVPLIIQAFHRDWALLVLYGAGGIIGYAFVGLLLSSNVGSLGYGHLAGRVVMLAITMGTAMLALNLLCRKNRVETRRLERLKSLTRVAQRLNDLSTIRDIPATAREIARILNGTFASERDAWVRILLTEENGQMLRAVAAPDKERPELKHEIPFASCPAVSANKVFSIEDADVQEGCPTERFSFFSHICVPVFGTVNETFGVIFAGSNQANAFGKEEREFLSFIGRDLGLTIQRLRRVEELQLSVELDSCAMAAFLASTHDVTKTFRSVLEGLKALLKADQVSLLLWNPQKSELEVRDAVGPAAAVEFGMAFRMGEGVPGRAFESGELASGDVSNERKFRLIDFRYRSLISMPLRNIRGETVGVANVWHRDNLKGLSRFQLDAAGTFVTRAALAIENALDVAALRQPTDRAA